MKIGCAGPCFRQKAGLVANAAEEKGVLAVDNISTTDTFCQEGSNIFDAPLAKIANKGRCPFCWTLRTAINAEGRFITYRVFCHHPGCDEWAEVHARMEAAPIVHWEQCIFAEVPNGTLWENFKDAASNTDWLGIPSATGTILVFANHVLDAQLERIGFQPSTHSSAEIQAMIHDVPDGRRLRKPVVKAKEEQPKKPKTIPIHPSLNYALPGVAITELEGLCSVARISTARTGVYADCIESINPITVDQATALADLMAELRMGQN